MSDYEYDDDLDKTTLGADLLGEDWDEAEPKEREYGEEGLEPGDLYDGI